jgi:hypothetical protein
MEFIEWVVKNKAIRGDSDCNDKLGNGTAGRPSPTSIAKRVRRTRIQDATFSDSGLPC